VYGPNHWLLWLHRPFVRGGGEGVSNVNGLYNTAGLYQPPPPNSDPPWYKLAKRKRSFIVVY